MRNFSSFMSQKPRASRMAMVRMSALASMGFLVLEGREKPEISLRAYNSGERGARRKQRRPTRSAPDVSGSTAEEVGCGANRDRSHRWKRVVARGGWADVARRCRPATSFRVRFPLAHLKA